MRDLLISGGLVGRRAPRARGRGAGVGSGMNEGHKKEGGAGLASAEGREADMVANKARTGEEGVGNEDLRLRRDAEVQDRRVELAEQPVWSAKFGLAMIKDQVGAKQVCLRSESEDSWQPQQRGDRRPNYTEGVGRWLGVVASGGERGLDVEHSGEDGLCSGRWGISWMSLMECPWQFPVKS